MTRWICFLPLLFLFISCERDNCTSTQAEWREWMTPNGKIKVLSTTAMIHDILKEVGGEFVDPQTLIQGQLDPHSYQLVKGDAEKLSNADLIFYNGLNLEHGPSLLYQLQTNKRAIPLGDRIEADHSELILYVKDQRDPHIWMDISIWSKIIPYIVKALSDIDPEHAEEYQKNVDAIALHLAQEHQNMVDTMDRIPQEKRYLVTSHDAFNYFAKAYLSENGEGDWGERFAAPEGLAPDSQLSATDIQKIIDHVRKYDVEVLFPETNVSRDSLNKILSAGNELGLNLRISDKKLFGDAMGCPGSGGETYLGMMRTNAETLERNLNGKK